MGLLVSHVLNASTEGAIYYRFLFDYSILYDRLTQEIIMTSFSQRKGLKPIKSILQVDSMDDDLRNSLWNALSMYYWSKVTSTYLSLNDKMETLVYMLYMFYFKLPADEVEDEWSKTYRAIRDYFFACEWNEVYDFIEFIANSYPVDDYDDYNEEFKNQCNIFLEQEMSAYRFVGGQIVQITSEEEIIAIEEVLTVAGPLQPVRDHIKVALGHLADRESPDYRNSIKESISAVEAICRIITSESKATLGQAIKKVKEKVEIHPALEDAFGKLYGYTSDENGIRHSLMEQSSIDFEDAKFMLVSCSAFTNFLIAESSKAGIELQ